MKPTTCPSATQTHVSAFGRYTLGMLWRSSSRNSSLRKRVCHGRSLGPNSQHILTVRWLVLPNHSCLRGNLCS